MVSLEKKQQHKKTRNIKLQRKDLNDAVENETVVKSPTYKCFWDISSRSNILAVFDIGKTHSLFGRHGFYVVKFGAK